MLRLLVLLLLLANAAFFAWSQGLLMAWGLGPPQQSEPQRVQQQVRPDTVRVLSAGDLKQAEVLAAQAPRAAECLQSAALEPTQVDQLRSVLAGWPAGSWKIDAASEPARWIIYMGKFAGV